MKRVSLITIAVLLFLLSMHAAAADISVKLRIDRQEASLSDAIRLEVTIEGTRDGDIKPAIQGLEPFIVTPGGTSSRLEFINGRMTSGITYSYFLQPRKTGTFQIGPARVNIAGKDYQSDTGTIRVAAPSTGTTARSAAHFLRADLSRTDIFVEEQTVYTLSLFTRTQIRDLSLQLPEIDGLTFTRLGDPSEEQRQVDGNSYQVLSLRYAVTCERTGLIEIAPARMKMTVIAPRSRSRLDDFFNDPFFSSVSGRPLALESSPVALRVEPLPETGRPPDFGGLVGEFTIESRLEPDVVKAGESATLTVSVKGRGNIKRIPDLVLPEIPSIKAYKDQPVLQSRQEADGLQGSKTMKWALVPAAAGRQSIPPLTLSFFDPKARRYQTIGTPALTLAVQPGEAEKLRTTHSVDGGSRPEAAPKQTVQEVGRDLLPIHSAMADLLPRQKLHPGGWFFWALLLLPMLTYVSVFVFLKVRRYSAAGSAAARSRKAAREFNKTFAGRQLTPSQTLQAFRRYINQRFALNHGTLTPREAADILAEHGVSPETRQQVEKVLEQFEVVVYASRGDVAAGNGADLPKLVGEIEKEIK